MVEDKPDWSQASYQEMNDLVIRQGSRIGELELTLEDFTVANKIKDLALKDKDKRIADLEAEGQELAICKEWGKLATARIKELEEKLETSEYVRDGAQRQLKRDEERIAELEELGWRLYDAMITDSIHGALPREVKEILEKG